MTLNTRDFLTEVRKAYTQDVLLRRSLRQKR